MTLENTEKVPTVLRPFTSSPGTDSLLVSPSPSAIRTKHVKPSSLLLIRRSDPSTCKVAMRIPSAGQRSVTPHSPGARLPDTFSDITNYSFFYRMGRPPPKTAFPALRMDNVIPRAFAATWQQSMETWGAQIQRAVEGVSEMLAEGLGLERETFLEAGRFGSHLLAPTATDLRKYGKEGSSG